MPNLIELTASIIASQAASTSMSSEELLKSIQLVHESLKALEAGSPIDTNITAPIEVPKLTIKQAFKRDEIICMVCGKGGFKTLKRHIGQAHDLKPGQYRKQFGIPSTQKLAAKSYSEFRRQMAIDKGLGEGLAKARELRVAKKAAVAVEKIKEPTKAKAPAKSKKTPTAPAKKTKAPVPAIKEKAAVPTVRKKAAVSALRAKAQVPTVRTKAAVPAKVPKKK